MTAPVVGMTAPVVKYSVSNVERALKLVAQWLSTPCHTDVELQLDSECLESSQQFLRICIALSTALHYEFDWRGVLTSARGQDFLELLEEKAEGPLDFKLVCGSLARFPLFTTGSWGETAMQLSQVPPDGLCILMAGFRTPAPEQSEGLGELMFAFEEPIQMCSPIRATSTLHIRSNAGSLPELCGCDADLNFLEIGDCALVAESSIFLSSSEQSACSFVHVPASLLKPGCYLLHARHRRNNGMNLLGIRSEVLPFFGPSFQRKGTQVAL